jgi:hypothetical protein
MATLEELLGQYGLSEGTQTKVAAEQKTANDEVEQVLESLGLSGAEESVEKVASENITENKGERMSLTDIYGQLFGETTLVAEETQTTEKVASEEGNEATDLFGQLTAYYFGVPQGAFIDKVAGSVESEGQGQDEEQPMKHLDNKSQLGNSIGKATDPHMPLNHSASGGAKLQVTTGNTSPYSLKEKALQKEILKRMKAQPVGEYKD